MDVIQHFRQLLDDRRRVEAFRSAIRELISTQTRVAEIGSALGTYSLFAAQQNALKIYAIEMADVYYIGKESARQNGYADKIEFLHGKSTEIELPEKVDFIIMEEYTPFFFYNGLEEVVTDARSRFLRPGGKFIPNNIILKIAPVECPKMYHSLHLWEKQEDRLYDIDWSVTTRIAMNQPHPAQNTKIELLSPESTIKEIDLARDSNFPFSFSAKLEVSRPGTLHGLLGWWDCRFTPTQFFSNSPLAASNTWGQIYFPIRHPVSVRKGEKLKLQLHVSESRYSRQINYKWVIDHHSSFQEYNTFRAGPPDRARLDNFVLEHIPLLNPVELRKRNMLNLIDGQTNWRQIASSLVKKHPDQFPDFDAAMAALAKFARKTDS